MESESKNQKKSNYFVKIDSDSLLCVLCPHRCKIKKGKTGFCGFRKNVDNQLYSLNYGISTYFVIEPIETNAIFHFYPGESVLALGSIGCNLDCSFCQAWQYSKLRINSNTSIKQYFDYYTPEMIVEKAKDKDLKVISWTFNDPMSWFDFVLDTARLAKKEGIFSLFKSNHYINEAPLQELAKYVDVFSISIKSIEDAFYKKYCRGTLEPVLNAAKLLHKLKKHIEISNLLIPTLNTGKSRIQKLVDWIKENLGVDVPLHFARFHPDYKLKNIPRTPLSDISEAVELARNNGLKYVYSGNVFLNDTRNNSYCENCSSLLVSRMGGRTMIKNVSFEFCDSCKKKTPVQLSNRKKDLISMINQTENQIPTQIYTWGCEIFSIHIQISNPMNERRNFIIKNIFQKEDTNNTPSLEKVEIAPREKIRYTLNRINEWHKESLLFANDGLQVKLFENLDRAYYALDEINKPPP